MPLSASLQQRFDRIRETQPDYQPNAAVRQALAIKSLIAVVGPCAVGKSYVIDILTNIDHGYDKVRSITTRPPRPDDMPDTIQHFPWTEEGINHLCTHIETGDAVNYIIHPTTGELYGSLADSYPATYNLLPALSNSVASLRQLPFKRIYTIGLVAESHDWDHWFSLRAFDSIEERNKRLAEAIVSLEWLLSTPDAAIISNHANDPTYAADAIRSLVNDNPHTSERETAQLLLDHIRSLDK